ncbi:MAG TPA: hypothetical protein VMC48_01795, partial [Methanobacterium sp.]|nr:hypothetical protein [Methanobacterium sp.]
MGFLDDDSKGFLISMDLLVALIPLTIILGMVTADMGNIMYELEDTVFRGSMDRVAADTMNTLLETSGTPPNWEQTGNVSVVGLAKYDTSKGKPIEGTISPTKLSFVLNNSNLVQNLTGDNYSYYFTINTMDTNTSMGSQGTLNSSAPDIVRVDKLVLCSRLESVSSLVGEIRYTGQTRDYIAPSFQTSKRYTDSYDYYILFVNTGGASSNSATVKINTNSININSSSIYSAQLINSSYLITNTSNPTQFLNNSVEANVTSSAFGSSMDFYIVQVPKGTSASY